MELSSSNIKNFLHFIKIIFHCYYISRNGNKEKTSYILSKESFSYISGHGNP